jgi:hypothetical protein
MTSDRLLEELGSLAREERGQEGAEAPPPLAPAAQRKAEEQLTDRAMALLHGESGPQPARAPAADRPAPARDRWPWLRLFIAAPVAFAAAVSLFLLARPTGQALPEYAMRISGGVATVRGPGETFDAQTPRLRRGVPLAIVLVPAKDAPADDLSTVAYLTTGAGEAMWTPTREQLPNGAIRLSGAVPIDGPEGAGVLTVAVGRRRSWPQSSRELRDDAETRVYRRAFVWER